MSVFLISLPNNNWWGQESIKPLVTESSPFPSYLIPQDCITTRNVTSSHRNLNTWIILKCNHLLVFGESRVDASSWRPSVLLRIYGFPQFLTQYLPSTCFVVYYFYYNLTLYVRNTKGAITYTMRKLIESQSKQLCYDGLTDLMGKQYEETGFGYLV
jgi:hypothetical protein